MLSAGVRGREQRHHQIHRLIVKRIKRDRRIEPHHDRADAVDAFYPRVGNGDAFANARRADGLAFKQPFEYSVRVNAKNPRRHIRHQRERLTLSGRASAQRHRSRI